MPPHPLTNFEIPKYYLNLKRFNGVYSKNNLPKIKDGAYVINLDKYSDIRTHWIALHVLSNDVTYLDSFGVRTLTGKTLKLTLQILFHQITFKKAMI